MMRKATVLGVLLVCLGGAASAQLSINAAGATFPYPIYSKWTDEYHKKFPNIAINYQSIGSGGGIKQVTEATVDFGASDGPMTDQQIKDFKDKRGTDILHFPTVLGADVVTYNLPGVSAELSFTPEAIAGIFLGKITKWNDPEIAKANPKEKLPAKDIIVVHRSDSSGTTYIWTDYLCKISKEWEKGPGRGGAVNWPTGLGAKGNENVAGTVKSTENSIGYVELIYARQTKMPVGLVKNLAGKFVKPDLASVAEAAAAVADSMPEDFRVSITNGAGKGAYPIASFTYLLIPAKIADPAKKKAITDFLKWMLADGQNMVEALDYARLPKQVIAKETKAIAKVM